MTNVTGEESFHQTCGGQIEDPRGLHPLESRRSRTSGLGQPGSRTPSGGPEKQDPRHGRDMREVIYRADDTHPGVLLLASEFLLAICIGTPQQLQNSSARGRRNFKRARRSLYLTTR